MKARVLEGYEFAALMSKLHESAKRCKDVAANERLWGYADSAAAYEALSDELIAAIIWAARTYCNQDITIQPLAAF